MSALQTLRDDWAAARSGRPSVVHLRGLVGTAKTTFLDRFLEGLGDGVVVVRGRCPYPVHSPARRPLIEELAARAADSARLNPVAEEGAVPWLLPGERFLRAARDVAALPGTDDERAVARATAGLLTDLAIGRPLLLALDDAHWADAGTRAVVQELGEAFERGSTAHLLVVLVCTPISAGQQTWFDGPVRALPAVPEPQLLEAVSRRSPELDAAVVAQIAHQANGSLSLVHALLDRIETWTRTHGVAPEPLTEVPAYLTLGQLARGELPQLDPRIERELGMAAVLGTSGRLDALASLWDEAEPEAGERLLALAQTGLIYRRGSRRWAFVCAEVAGHYLLQLDAPTRLEMHRRAGALLRDASAQDAQTRGPHLDVTETWSESARRGRKLSAELERLRQASRHYSCARMPAEAAEAAIRLTERIFESAIANPGLAGRFGHRADRERRNHLQSALEFAASELELARAETRSEPLELLETSARLHISRARFKQMMGAFGEARSAVEMAVSLASHLPQVAARVNALQAQVEICYGSGDNHAGRSVLGRLLRVLESCPRPVAVPGYAWLAEAVGRWEWVGLHDRLFPRVLERLRALNAPKEAVRAQLERLAAATEADETAAEALLVDAITEARDSGLLPFLAEHLSLYAADLIQGQVDAHFDSLSGEFFPPDLYGEAPAPAGLSLPQRLARPVDLLTRAEVMAEQGGDSVVNLRVLTTVLGVIYETRERFAQLLDKWMPEHRGQRPTRLMELLDALERGFFDIDHIESLSERALALGTVLGLDQVVADTIYEALDRSLPGAISQAESLFGVARRAYKRLGDVYGLLTLALVEERFIERSGGDSGPALAGAIKLLEGSGASLTDAQRAFAHACVGERLLADDDVDQGTAHLEHAIRVYDDLGDVDRVQTVGAQLSEQYKKRGDFGRYRALRERFRNVEGRAPSVDPLGLEFRVEFLLNRARHEPDDEKAIEMVERCVEMFARVPDATTRVDECFVEISKICRRRADGAQTEAAFHGWLRRSLDAARAAASINRSLENYHRVFEECHELFDDLLGLGEFDDYLRARRESRALAFSVGNIAELLYLFDEHLQHDPETGYDLKRLPEARGFFESLIRYLLGLGSLDKAVAVQRDFVRFLRQIDERTLADHYEGWRLAT